MSRSITARYSNRGLRLASVAPIFHVALRGQTYLNVLYLIASLPLGLAYFVFLVVGLAVGVSSSFVLVGVPILLGLGAAWWWLGRFERELALWWLGIEIPPIVGPNTASVSLPRRVVEYVFSPVTWTILAYLLLRFPLGVLGFSLSVGAIALIAWLAALPVAFVTGAVGGVGAGIGAFVGPPLAVALFPVSLHGLNFLATRLGALAFAMLGTSDTARKLQETEARAERQEVKAERAEQSRRELIVNVSHELRTPAASIRGHVESLLLAVDGVQPDSPAPPELRQYLSIVQRETERLNALVDDLLSLARAEAGELRLEVGPVDAAGVVEEVYETLAPLARREREVTVVREVEPGLPSVSADRQRLSQVLLNLIRNAITYTPEGGIVSVTLRRSSPGHLALTVSDTGVGIPAEDLDRVFDRFYRADASRTRASGGFGLGLAIVRDLVEAMGGTVGAESTPGAGSTFQVRMPIAAPHER